LIVKYSQVPPSREFLGHEAYAASWRTVRLGGAITGAMVFCIGDIITALRRKAGDK